MHLNSDFGKHFEGGELIIYRTISRWLYKVRINQKVGDREKYEPRRGFSFAPGVPKEGLYAINHNLYALKNLLKNWWHFLQ